MKKLFSILVLGLLFSGNAYAGTCKTPKNPKEKFVLAPEPVSYTRKSPTNRIEEVLSNRKTINVFRAYNNHFGNIKNYGLVWAGTAPFPNDKMFSVAEVYWNYAYPNTSWHRDRFPGDGDKFLTNRNWGHNKEYGKTVAVNIKHPEYLSYTEQRIKSRTYAKDGVLFDWWHNRHKHAGGYSEKTVKRFRTALAKQTREKFGKDFLIIGNVNWDKDTGTHKYLNGAWMELYKKNERLGGYDCGQIKLIGELLKFHDQNLQEPRLVAFEPWKISKVPPKNVMEKLEMKKFGVKISNDQYKKFFNISRKKYWKAHYRSSPENIKFAKLFTAMAMVIPENGYILYGDNNPDEPTHDHLHEFYDFYNTDLGKETSIGMEITEGLGFKMYEKGVIVYNYTKKRYKIEFTNQKEVTIDPLEGMFVEF